MEHAVELIRISLNLANGYLTQAHDETKKGGDLAKANALTAIAHERIEFVRTIQAVADGGVVFFPVD